MADAARIKVLLDKGRNYFSSFFTELDGVRKELGDKVFVAWCDNELGVSIGIITNLSNTLERDDRLRVNREFSSARARQTAYVKQQNVPRPKLKKNGWLRKGKPQQRHVRQLKISKLSIAPRPKLKSKGWLLKSKPQ
jgi:hypothetical protein